MKTNKYTAKEIALVCSQPMNTPGQTFDGEASFEIDEQTAREIEAAHRAVTTMAVLKEKLPRWHFEPYGKQGAVACFPPNGTGRDAYLELKQVAFISSVCGPLYAVVNLK